MRVLIIVFTLALFSASASDAAGDVKGGRRAGKPEGRVSSRFADRGDGTVVDVLTGLMWLKNANPGGAFMPYQSAVQYVKDMNSGKLKNFGHVDWRMPSVEELESLIDRTQLYPSIHKGHPFESVQNYYYWSSTGGTNISDYVWVADMSSGDIKMEYKSFCSFNFLWPVRGTLKEKDADSALALRIREATPEDTGENVIAGFIGKRVEQKSKLLAELDALREKLSEEKSALEEKKTAIEKKGTGNAPPEELKAVTVSTYQINLSWGTMSAKTKIAGYNIYRDGDFLKSVKGTSFMESDLKPDTKYCYTVAAFDSSGNETKHSRETCQKTLSAPDGKPPTVPAGLTVSPAASDRIELKWKPSTDNIGVRGYRIYQNDVSLKEVEDTSASVTGLSPDTEYCYIVTALDATGNESVPSRKSCAKTLYVDNMKPTTPAGLTASELGNEISLSWGASEDNRAVAAYNVYQDGVLLKTVARPALPNQKINRDETHCYTVSAVDAAGNESMRSHQICVSRLGATAGKAEADVAGKWGTVWAGGWNRYGQLGDGTVIDRVTLVMVKELHEAVIVASSVEHALALKADGTVWAWGRNDRGQLGDGTKINRPYPVQVKGLSGVVGISAGKSHSLALKSDGTVWAWGRNYYGQLGDGNYADRLSPVQTRDLTDAVAISAGWYHSAAVKADGTVWTWGLNGSGQLGNGILNNSNRPVQVKALSGVKAIAAGMDHTVALKSDGTVWTWGRGDGGQLGSGTIINMQTPVQAKDVSGVEAISAGMDHTAALKSDGTVLAWGKNDYGQIGNGSKTIFHLPAAVEGISGVKGIAAGAYHTVAIKQDGTVWAWGWRLTRNIQQDLIPTQISGLTDVAGITAGKRYTVVIKGKVQ